LLNEHLSIHNSITPDRTRLDEDRRGVRESIRQFEGQIAASDARAQSLTNQIANDRQRHETLAHDRQSASQAKAASQIEFDNLQSEIQDLESTRNELEESAKRCAAEIIEKRRQRVQVCGHRKERSGIEHNQRVDRGVVVEPNEMSLVPPGLRRARPCSPGCRRLAAGAPGVAGIAPRAISISPCC
jgi:chromosome segregation ATPase